MQLAVAMIENVCLVLRTIEMLVTLPFLKSSTLAIKHTLLSLFYIDMLSLSYKTGSICVVGSKYKQKGKVFSCSKIIQEKNCSFH